MEIINADLIETLSIDDQFPRPVCDIDFNCGCYKYVPRPCPPKVETASTPVTAN